MLETARNFLDFVLLETADLRTLTADLNAIEIAAVALIGASFIIEKKKTRKIIRLMEKCAKSRKIRNAAKKFIVKLLLD